MMVPARALVLASASPRRQEILRALRISHQVAVSRVEETLSPSPDPTDPLPAARAKAADIATQHPGAIILAGDTIVAIDRDALGKPGSISAAVSMLQRLRGRAHAVHTAVVVQSDSGRSETCVKAPLRMRRYTDAEIEAYVATEEPMDCAGAYDVHRRGGGLVETVDGCFSAVVGLPIAETARLLSLAGVDVPVIPAAVCSELYGRLCLVSGDLTRPRCLPERGRVSA